jgi:hypothetical protein
MTLYDRTSYEYDESSQDTIGNGIFGMEEGVTWRTRDGSFANQYALPAYLADEDELGVQQSEMWDSTAGEWRVTQPSASGVALARRVSSLKPAYSPFASDQPAGPAQMRPEVTGPRSHIEAFGRKVAKALVNEARMQRPASRGAFLKAALDSLGPGGAQKAKLAADRLVKLGYRPDVAFEDAAAHLVMHAATKDLTDRGRRNSSQLPRLDTMGKKVGANKAAVQNAAVEHLMPLTRDGQALRKDLGALYHSPAGRGMGDVVNGNPGEVPVTDAPEEGKLLTTLNVLIAGGIGVGAYLLFANRKTIAKNIKKIVK